MAAEFQSAKLEIRGGGKACKGDDLWVQLEQTGVGSTLLSSSVDSAIQPGPVLGKGDIMKDESLKSVLLVVPWKGKCDCSSHTNRHADHDQVGKVTDTVQNSSERHVKAREEESRNIF